MTTALHQPDADDWATAMWILSALLNAALCRQTAHYPQIGPGGQCTSERCTTSKMAAFADKIIEIWSSSAPCTAAKGIAPSLCLPGYGKGFASGKMQKEVQVGTESDVA